MAKREIVFDTETTGLSVAEGDRIISMACVEMLDGKPAREIEFFVNPGRPSNPHALAVHGLTEEFLADKPRFFVSGATAPWFCGEGISGMPPCN